MSFYCERLRLTSMLSPCYGNRAKRLFACDDCAGAVMSDSILEADDMSKTLCNVKGCDRLAQANTDGMCKSHFSGRPSRKLVQASIVAVAANVIDESGWVQPVMEITSEISSIDYMAFLRQKYEERFEESVTRMNKAQNPYERASLYLRECDAIMSLEC